MPAAKPILLSDAHSAVLAGSILAAAQSARREIVRRLDVGDPASGVVFTSTVQRTNKQREIKAWNAAVDARKRAKKRGA